MCLCVCVCVRARVERERRYSARAVNISKVTDLVRETHVNSVQIEPVHGTGGHYGRLQVNTELCGRLRLSEILAKYELGAIRSISSSYICNRRGMEELERTA
jgi:hypothetical protein